MFRDRGEPSRSRSGRSCAGRSNWTNRTSPRASRSITVSRTQASDLCPRRRHTRRCWRSASPPAATTPTPTATAATSPSRERRAVPRRTLRGQPGRRHHHLSVELRLRRGRLDRRGARRRGTRLLRRAVPRRRNPAQLLDRQLPAGRRRTTRSSRRAARSARSSRSPTPTRPTSWPSRSRAARRSTA